MVVGPPSFLSPQVRRAWDEAGVDLQGPVAAGDLAAGVAGVPLDGAVIDLNYDAPSLMSLVELFDTLDVPSLFASTVPEAQRGFSLSADRADINAIVHQLLGTHQTTLQ